VNSGFVLKLFESYSAVDRFAPILLKNSFGQLENQFIKNTDFIERSAIDEHSSVGGLKPPEILFRMVQK
jgi:hypothetical protein